MRISATLEPGDSGEQREAEGYLITEMSRKLHAQLAKKKFELVTGECLEVDGFCDLPTILCEAWAHQGTSKSAQKHKVMTDALKLLFLERYLRKPSRKILLFGDPAAAKHFQGSSWMARAIETLGIEVVVIELPNAQRNAIRLAQKRQYR